MRGRTDGDKRLLLVVVALEFLSVFCCWILCCPKVFRVEDAIDDVVGDGGIPGRNGDEGEDPDVVDALPVLGLG
jgi:hypothetical protein